MRYRSRVIRVKSGCAFEAVLVDDDRASKTGTKQGVATQTTHNTQ